MSRGSAVNDNATTDDLLDFSRLAVPLARKIATVDRDDTPWTIGLYGEWGAGKTSFLRMVERELGEYGIQPVWFNAWRYSREENLWAALLQTVLDRARISGPIWRRPVVSFRLWRRSINLRAGAWEVARKVSLLAVRLVLLVVGGALAVTLVAPNTKAAAAIQDLLAGQSVAARLLSNPAIQGILAGIALLVVGPEIVLKLFDVRLGIDFSKISKHRSYREKVAFLDEFSAEMEQIVQIACGKRPLVVIVDDLDRCHPEQALQIVDAVKMFLDVPGCIFILAMDREIIEDATVLKYGSSVGGARLQRLRETYVERIVQLAVPLPPARPEAARRFVQHLWAADGDVIACHPILIGVPPYNPRRIKRYVQSFQLARDYYPLAEDGSALRPSLLAKLTVIQYSYRDLYKEIIDNGRLLESLEATYRAAPDTSDGEGPDGDGGAGRHYRDNYPHLPTLLRLRIDDGDTFAGVDLQPYLSVFRDLTVSADAGDPAGGPSDDGNERTLVSEYLQRLRRRFRGVDLEVLTPVTEQEETPTIPLAEIFVEPWVREDVAPVELPRELVRQLVAAGGVDSSRELPAGISPDLLSRVYREQQRRPAQRLGSLLSGPAIRMVLLGDPGSGKSTAARWLALTLATGERSSAVPLSGWLPLLVQLREYATSGSETVLDYLEAAHAADDLGLPRPIVERWMLDDGRVLLILDGLDEIADPVARDMAARQITALAVRYPRIGIVVTARPVSHNRSIFHSAGFSHWVLQDFDREQVSQLAERWYAAAYPSDREAADRLAKRLVAAVDTSVAVRELSGNPLLLTILAIMGRRRTIPRDRATIYQHALSVLIEQWDPSKFLAAEVESLPYLDAADRVEMLRQVARRMQSGTAGLSGNFISGSELIDVIADYLREPNPGDLGRDQARRAAQMIVRQLRERNFVLSRFGSEVYGFVSRAFLEYLVADDIRIRYTTERSLSDEDLIATFERHWADPAWREVLVLLSGLLPEMIVEQVVARLFQLQPHWTVGEPNRPGHLVLAIRCLGEMRRVGAGADAATSHIVHMLTIAHRHRNEALCRTVELEIVPVLARFAGAWPGRGRYWDWYRGVGRVDTDDAATSLTACRIGVAMFGPSADIYEYLVEHAKSGRSDHHREAAIISLAENWGGELTTRELLLNWAQSDRSPAIRATSLEALASAWPTSEETIRILDRSAASDEAAEVRETAIRAIAAIAPAEAGLDAIRFSASNDAVFAVRRAALTAIASVAPDRDHAPPWLLNLLASAVDPSDRSAVVDVLARTWAADPQVASLVRTRAVEDPSPWVRRTAVMAIGAVALFDAADLVVTIASRDVDFEVCAAALEVLARRWPDHSATLPLVRVGIESPAEAIAIAAAKVIADRWFHNPDLHRLLMNRMNVEENAEVRRAAIREIGRAWGYEPEAEVWLRDQAEADPDDQVRQAAIELLVQQWPNLTTARWLRTTMISDGNPGIREAAIRAAAALGASDPDTLPFLVRCAKGDKEPHIREAALRTAVDGWPDALEVRAIVNHLAGNDRSLRVRRVAVKCAAILVDDGVVPPTLHEAMTDKAAEVRSAALESMALRLPADPETRRILTDTAASDSAAGVRQLASALLMDLN